MSAKKNDDVVKPRIIELDADAVTVVDDTASGTAEESQAAPQPEMPHAPAPKKKSGKPWLLPAIALLAGLAGGGWLYRDVLSNYLPTTQVSALEGKVAQLQASGTETATVLKTLAEKSGGEQAKLQSSISAMSAQVNVIAGQHDNLAGRMDALEKQAAQLATDLAKLRTAPAPSATAPTADSTAVTELQHRISALEVDVAALKQQTAMPNPLAQGMAAFAALHGRIDKGEPFTAELTALSGAVNGLSLPAALTETAATGVTPPRILASDLRLIAASLPKTTAEDATATGYWATVKKALKGIISIRQSGVTDWPAMAIAAADLAEQGKLADAIATLSSSGTPPDKIASWIQKADARSRAETALASLSNTIMQQVTAP